MHGELVVFDGAKGYGFIRPATGGDDVFVHVNDVLFDKQSLVVGAQLIFDVDDGDRGPKAHGVELAHDATVSPPASSPAAPSARTSYQQGGIRVQGSADALRTELTEALLNRVPSLTGEQLLQVRAVAIETLTRSSPSGA